MKKVPVLYAVALLLVQAVSALDVPDMVAPDVSGTLLQPYYLSTTEVTQSLYQEITDSNPSSCVQETAAFSKLLAGEEQENRPVETLTFFDAMQFCNLLTEKTLGAEQCVYTLSDPVYDSEGHIIRFGLVAADFSKTGYRLPTREEWLNAAGTEPASQAMYAWFVDNSAARGEGRTGFGTHAVAKKLPNAEGFYDMYGNVAEMCHEGETLDLCIEGTAWNRLDDFYTDGYSVDWLYGYSQYTVSRNHARESFAGYDTCGFRLCRSISDLPFTLTGISVPDVCDTYDGIVPVSIKGSGFLCRRTEPLSVRVEGFASKTAGSVEWLTDDSAIIPVQAETLVIEGSQTATLRVIVETSAASAEITGTLSRIHSEFPLYPADVLLDDGSVISYEEDHVFSGFEKEHAAAVIIYAPYGGTEVLALGLKAYEPLFADEDIASFLSNYGERAGIFGTYLGSGWYVPSAKELEPLSDSAFRSRVSGILSALNADAADALNADSVSDSSVSGLVVPVKSINTRALITQKYEYLTANDMLKEAAEQDARLAEVAAQEEARVRAEQEAAEKAAREAAEAEERERAIAREAALAEERARALAEAEAAAAEEAAEDEKEPSEARTLIGFGFDALELTKPVQTFYGELSTGLFTPFLYLAAEGNMTLGIKSRTLVIPYVDYPLTLYGLKCPYWDAALNLGLSVRMKLGKFHPDLFVSGGVMTNSALIDDKTYIKARFEAGLDIPLFKRLTLTARYSADLSQFDLTSLMDNYRLTAGVSIAFPSFILF